MKRQKIIESLVNQFAENIANLSDETLQDVESGNLVISLTPAVENEAGGRTAALAAKTTDIVISKSTDKSSTKLFLAR